MLSTPTVSSNFVNELHDVINIVSSRYPTLPLFLRGDFNIPNISWNSEPPSIDPVSSLATEFLNLCSVFSFTQLIKQPTRTTQSVANTLDLVLTSQPDLVSEISYLPGLSDHCLITFQICLSRPKNLKKIKIIRNYTKANFEAINYELSTFLDNFLNGFDNRTVQTNWDIFVAKVNDLTNKYIPTFTITSNSDAPWYSRNLKRLSNKNKNAYINQLNYLVMVPAGLLTNMPPTNM